jgi:hypothetical protein
MRKSKPSFLLIVSTVGLQLDRGNLSNALTDDLLADLHLTTNDYNNVRSPVCKAFLIADYPKGTTIQLLCFLTAEFPVQMLTKRYGFKLVLPTMMMAWGTVCMLIRNCSIPLSLTLDLSSLGTSVDQQPSFLLRDKSLDWCL